MPDGVQNSKATPRLWTSTSTAAAILSLKDLREIVGKLTLHGNGFRLGYTIKLNIWSSMIDTTAGKVAGGRSIMTWMVSCSVVSKKTSRIFLRAHSSHRQRLPSSRQVCQPRDCQTRATFQF